VKKKNNWDEIANPSNLVPVILLVPTTCEVGKSAPKRRHLKFRRWGITHKKEYNIHNTVKV
jgi:hypothetical protein